MSKFILNKTLQNGYFPNFSQNKATERYENTFKKIEAKMCYAGNADIIYHEF